MQMHPQYIIVQLFHLHLVLYGLLLIELLDQKSSKPRTLKSIKRKPKRIYQSAKMNNFYKTLKLGRKSSVCTAKKYWGVSSSLADFNQFV